MKNWIKSGMAALGVAVLLSGCGGPRYKDVANSVPVMAPDAGRIYFYQPPAPAGVVSNQPYLRVNGVKVGRSKPGSFFYVNRPAGNYEVDTLRDGEALSFTLAPGQTRYVRMSIEGVSGNSSSVGRQEMRLEESEAAARQEMEPLRYWGAGSRERVKLSP
ncbi:MULTISPECIES: DUF2846 domain-containing protein [Achromobacter]|jgi:hypothetical protein|uniref:DUF2846 domain-containing protein n=1 Tax=Achromobacter denitrificans TaxID=32002 RepID=A0A6N0JLA3_ACHDE|nr:MULTISPECIES: DUF2846 domain-containing protein [Achromobacter]MDF3858873.1 DUF2846 domain-containing protein [Achromobacter denitrificans]QKQ47889.1 DUF2846 domain-containing protein [Achromobacter denitrificans]